MCEFGTDNVTCPNCPETCQGQKDDDYQVLCEDQREDKCTVREAPCGITGENTCCLTCDPANDCGDRCEYVGQDPAND